MDFQEDFLPDLVDVLNQLSFMDLGREFELNLDEINEIVNKLIYEGEKEELSASIPEIKDRAEDLIDPRRVSHQHNFNYGPKNLRPKGSRSDHLLIDE